MPDQNIEQNELRRRLAQDIQSGEDIEATLKAVTRLRQAIPPAGSADSRARLIELMRTEIRSSRRTFAQKLAEWWPPLLVRAQVRIVRQELWLASALVLAIGGLVTLRDSGSSVSLFNLPLALIAPMVAAAGMALLYDNEVAQSMEIEDSTPATLRLILLARMLLVYGFNLGLALAASLLIAGLRADIGLGPLIGAWLAPMTFLSMLAFLISVITRDSLAGVAFSLGIWSVFVVIRNIPEILIAQAGIDFEMWYQTFMLTFGMIAGIAALWLAGRDQQFIGQTGA